MAVIKGSDTKELKDYVEAYVGDKDEYTLDDYNKTFCELAHGGIRSEAGSSQLIVIDSDSDDDESAADRQTLFFKMDCTLYDLDKADFTKDEGTDETYLIHFHYQFTNDTISGIHLDEDLQTY